MRKSNLLIPLVLMIVVMPSLAARLQAAQAPADGTEISDNIYDGAILSRKIYLMVGDRGRIFRTENGGVDWAPIQSGTKDNLFSVSFPDDANGWICGDKGLILHTGDGGLTWHPQPSATKRDLLAVDFCDPRHGLAAGDWGAVVITEDGGASWQDVSLPEDMVIYDVIIIDAGHLLVAGEFGMIFESTDSGRHWKPLIEESGLMDIPKTIFAIDYHQSTLYTAGMDGQIQFTVDGGKTWGKANNASHAALYNIQMEGLTGWAVGDLGTVLKTLDGGKNWTTVSLPQSYRLSWICALDMMRNSPLSGFAAGSKGLFLNIRDNQLNLK